MSAQDRINAVMALDPADHATTSRDYGRGFAECLRVVKELLATPDDEVAGQPAPPGV